MVGDAGESDPPGVQLDEEQDVEGPEAHRLNGEEVAGHDAVAWVRRNARQVRDARRGGVAAELLELALGALVAPAGFSRASRRISATTCWASGGRPPRRRGCVHLRVTRRRCHRMIVSGVTSKIDQCRQGNAAQCRDDRAIGGAELGRVT